MNIVSIICVGLLKKMQSYLYKKNKNNINIIMKNQGISNQGNNNTNIIMKN